MGLDKIIKDAISEIGTDLTSEFDRNFERKSFFGNNWPASRHGKGGNLMDSGA